MKRNQTPIGIPALGMLALFGMVTFPLTGLAAGDTQAEALRGQEEAIRRMEAAQARMLANSQQLAQQTAEQARSYIYPYYPYSAPSTPGTPESLALSPVAPEVPVVVDRARHDPVSRVTFASTQSGVLVVSAGGDAPFGLQDGDVIISVDGRVPIDGPHAVRILRSYQPGERVKLRVQRDRRAIDLDTIAPG